MKELLFLLILLINTNVLSAGEIYGNAYDIDTRELLVGATVYVKNLKKGVITGLDGSYILKNIPIGKYSISASLISYKPIEKEIEIKSENDIVKLELIFEPVSQNLNEVTIIYKRDKSTDMSARYSEKNAINIINVISAKSIELSPDLTVANVIQRMSGITVERSNSGDGQYAILRGMDKRYNYTLVNGIKIPSTDNKYRYLPLDLFPSDMVDRLEVTKVLTPSQEGDAIGGIVNLLMKDAPEKFQIRANAAIGYNQMFLERDFISFSATDIQKKSPYEANGSNYKATEKDFPVKNLDITPLKIVPNQVAGLSVGNRFLNNKLGALIAGSYLKNFKGSNSLFFDISSTNDERNLPKLSSRENRQYNEEQTQYGLHSKLDYRLNHNHTIKMYNAYISLENKQVRDISTIEFNSYVPGNGTYTKNYETRNRFNIQQLFNSTLQGEHNLSERIALKWSGVFSKAINKSPDNTKISLVSDLKDFVEQHVYVVEKSCTRRWTRNSDQDIAGYLDIEYTPTILNIPVKLSFGGVFRDKRRTSFYNQYTLIPVSDRAAPFQYFSEKGVEWDNYSEIHWEIINPPDPTHPLNYDASENIKAGYFQFDFQIDKIQCIGGVRAENTNQGYVLHYEQYGSNPIGNQTYTDLLPSAHLKYRLTGSQNLRLSYYRGLNRPGFLEIVPFEDKTEEYTEAGNASLKRAIADNFDARYEFFPNALDQFMAGIFYKNIKDPIEYCFIENGATKSIIYTPNNFGTAHNLGVEIDLIKYFRNIGIKANYTFTLSEITTSKLLLQRDNNGNLYKTFPNQVRPLFGQSKHMANLSFLYKNTRIGWDAQIAASYSSDRITVVSQYLDNDTWEKGAIKLDFSSEKQVGKNLGVFIKINNLLNTPREQYIRKVNPDYSGFSEQNKQSGKTLVRRDYYMPSYLLGIRVRFN